MEADPGSLIVRRVTEESITVYWTSISGATDGYDIKVHNINNNHVDEYRFYGNMALLPNLTPGATYDIQMKAVNIDGGDSQRQATSKYFI